MQVWAGGKNSNDSKGEMNSTEESTAGAAHHIFMAQSA